MLYAVVRLRGRVNVRPEVRYTLKLLRLNRINHCAVVPANEYYRGMLNVIKDYVAWGEISEGMLSMLLKRRGRLEGGKRLTEEYLKENTPFQSFEDLSRALMKGEIKMKDLMKYKIKPIFRLHPPRKGHKGIKKSFEKGGELGYHGDKINELLYKMR